MDDKELLFALQWMARGEIDPANNEEVPQALEIDHVVGKIAMLGYDNPEREFLILLEQGVLVGMGHCQWTAYIDSQKYVSAGHELISSTRWRVLLNRYDEKHNAMVDGTYEPTMLVPSLSPEKLPKFRWEWRDRWFSTLALDDAGNTEHFEAYDIILSLVKDRAISNGAPQMPSNAKGGRPKVYDWEKAVAGVVFRWADSGTWQPRSQADVQRALADWFADKGATPSDSLLKERARWLHKEFESREPEGH